MADASARAAEVLARCRARVANDPALAMRLAPIDGFSALRDAIVAECAASGGPDDAAALSGVDLSQVRPAMAPAQWPECARRGWQPFALEWDAGGAELLWGCGETDARAPFHESTLAALRTRPFKRCLALRMPLAPARVDDLERSALPLAGLVLHESRCGSTLVAQSLKAWPGTRVVGEPALLDTALFAALAGHDPGWLLFRGTLAALCQPAGDDVRVIVKLDAWHALALGTLRARMPAVPWLFVYRDPLEVLVSHAREPGRHTVPGMLPETWLPPLAPGDVTSPVAHAARVLGALCTAVAAHAGAANLVDYDELVAHGNGAPPPALARDIPRHFGLDPDDADPARLAAALARDTKRPGERFEDDRASKRAAATEAVRAAADRWIAPHHAALQAIRQGR